MRFLLTTAWLDAKSRLKHLSLCALAIVFGVAAMVAIDSFTHNVRDAIEDEAMTLLGADLQVSSRTPFSDDVEFWIQSLGGERARETRFSSMAYFHKDESTRLVQVRALEGGFPFYGTFKTNPEGANPAEYDEPVATIDSVLMAQYELKVGDTLSLGEIEFKIIGEIVEIPGESGFAGLFAPRIYIPKTQLDSTGLIETGSIAFHRVYIKNNTLDTRALRDFTKANFAEDRLNLDDVEERKEDVGEPLENLTRYLGLVGFISLLLGGVGIAGSIQAYLLQKRDTVAILRCLGSSSKTAFSIFLLQISGVAGLGAIAGAILGVGIQTLLPRILAPLLPVDLEFFISWPSILSGASFGFLIAVLFALFPLLPIRNISPLRALRARIDEGNTPRDKFTIPLALLTGATLTAYCMAKNQVWWHGLIFAAFIGVAFFIFWAAAKILQFILKKLPLLNLYLLRQALSNLYRPQNRTTFLLVSIGMGTFLVYTLTLVQTGLLQQSERAATGDDPNLLLFDIQPDQREAVYQTIQDAGLVIEEEAPIVTMRLKSVKGRSVSEIRKDPENKIDGWILNREWRNTYRSAPRESEVLIAGEYVSEWEPFKQPVPVSLEEDMAKDLGVTLGDKLEYDVQGIPIEVVVSSLRTVDWLQMRPNFFVTFPTGVLEAAPHWWIAVTRSPDVETTAALQRDIFLDFPNVSAVDLQVVLSALENVLSKISFAVRFMALFTIGTGIVVLASAITTSRYQRVRESVLLRTLGASGKQVRGIMAIEYLMIGAIAASLGIIIAMLAAWALARFLLEIEVVLPISDSVLAALGVAFLTLITGMLNSRGIAQHPPLSILRDGE
ncbi:MAG: ABC transporter permease [Opitutales bacterium]